MNARWLKSTLRWINGHPGWGWRRVPVWGSRLRAPTFDRWLALQLHRRGWMGVADRAFLETRIRPGMTVVDIGANQGLYTMLFAQLATPAGRVLAFEPDALLHGALAENAAFNRAGNVELHALALGAARGTLTLHRSLLNSGDNRLAAGSAERGGPRDAAPVRVERLDALLSGTRVDFIKMDVQGWEMEVLRGMSGLLTTPGNGDPAIYFEYWPQGLRDAGSDPVEPLTFLADHGFTVYSLDGERLGAPIEEPGTFARSIPASKYVNLFAVRSPNLPRHP